MEDKKMKAKPGDFIIPEEPENVFSRLQKVFGDLPEFVHIMDKYEVLDVKKYNGVQDIYIILGIPSLFESEMNRIFGKYKIC